MADYDSFFNERVVDSLDYNPSSGVITWKVDRYARKIKGNQAGTVKKDKNRQTSYREIKIDYKTVKAHSVAWFLFYGYWPEQIDHIDGDGLNNSLRNLREASSAENAKNKPIQRNNSSGCSGVSWYRTLGKWRASISVNGKKQHLGYFESKDGAIKVRKSAEKLHGYHENHGRKPQ